ncbi:hypothetical protein TNIN_43221 [Trichonephila inaurata madagascariensis]|uniref:Uncharacterized protein n=1 Tax=Trichonephila inaurata madagascariensis TaxID=2747483 RepID=A0A8X6Y4A2_9ARAC|nr:hypothetical protein TNIN_43221 [Trichonephila inaurata madagascariensis]
MRHSIVPSWRSHLFLGAASPKLLDLSVEEPMKSVEIIMGDVLAIAERGLREEKRLKEFWREKMLMRAIKPILAEIGL